MRPYGHLARCLAAPTHARPVAPRRRWRSAEGSLSAWRAADGLSWQGPSGAASPPDDVATSSEATAAVSGSPGAVSETAPEPAPIDDKGDAGARPALVPELRPPAGSAPAEALLYAVREQGEESPALVTVDGVDYTAVIVRHEDGRDRVELRCDGLLAGDGWYENGAICEDEPAGFPEEVYWALEAVLRTGGPG